MNAHTEMMKNWKQDPAFNKAYDNLADEFALFDEMLSARKKAGLTQEAVAQSMGTKKSAVARLEASGGKKQHSPSLNTLRKYAAAIGCRLEIKFRYC